MKGFLRGGRKSTGNAEGDEPNQKPMQEENEEMVAQFTDEELQEFLEADRLDVTADPAFKERLRRKLWEIVRARARDDSEGEGF